MVNYPLVIVEWEDSLACSSWATIDDIEDTPLICQSVGWLTHNGEEAKVVVQHITKGIHLERAQANGFMVIPSKSVISIEVLAHSGNPGMGKKDG